MTANPATEVGGASQAGGTTSMATNAGGSIGVGGVATTATGGTANGSGGARANGGVTQIQGGGPGQGGASSAGQGTSATGGKASAVGGGQSSGGVAASGGTGSAGGKASGGTNVGGTSNGGTATGGRSATGGTAIGGTAAGGVATGGKADMGGASTGGSGVTLCPGATQTLTVAADGSGQYTTVQAAINAISSSNSKLVQVNVKAGTYNEQVTINRPYVCLTGASAASTIITHTIDTNIVTGGTVLLTGNDFSAANITFQNSAADGSAQRVALMAQGQRQQFYNCRFISYQDTLYTNTGTQYFKDCYIQGNTDYIFGDATAVFQNCTMYSASQGTAVTAPRTPQGNTYGFVFLGGALTASAATGTARVNLGRPWGPYAAAAFLNVALGAHITSAGWTTMSSNTLQYTRFSEYKSTGAGANTTDATRSSRQLGDAQAANYTVAKVLSPWLPGYSQ